MDPESQEGSKKGGKNGHALNTYNVAGVMMGPSHK